MELQKTVVSVPSSKRCTSCRTMQPLTLFRKYNRTCNKCCERGRKYYLKMKEKKKVCILDTDSESESGYEQDSETELVL